MVLRQTEHETGHRHELIFCSFFFVLIMFHGFTADENLIGCRTVGSNRQMIQLLQRKGGSSSQERFHWDGRCCRTEGYSNYKTMQVHSDRVQSSIQKKHTNWAVTLVQVDFPSVDCAAEMVWKLGKETDKSIRAFFHSRAFFKPWIRF